MTEVFDEYGNYKYHTDLPSIPTDASGTGTPSPWHTEPPTEDGQYFVAYRWGLDNQMMHDMVKQICYGATVFSHGTWKVEFPFIVLAWQKIEPFEEAST